MNARGPDHDDDGQVEITRLLLLPLLPLSTLALAAPVKIITGCSATSSLVGAVLLVALFVAALWRLERHAAQPIRAATLTGLLVAFAVVAAMLVRLLYNPRVFGMVNAGYQPDAGTHIHFSRIFNATTGGAAPYEGCLAFHAVAWWLARIFSLSALSDLRLVFYLVVISVPLTCSALAAAVVPRRASPGMIACAFLLLVGTITRIVFFPLLHGFQTLASYPQLFSLLPLLVGWALYAACTRPASRLLAATFALGLLRYTYGLNLGDLALTFCLLAIFEALELKDVLGRVTALLLAVALAYAALTVYRTIWPMRVLDGPRPLVGLLLRPAMWGQLVAALFLAVAPSLLRLAPSAMRVFRFAALFGLSTALVQYLYLAHHQPEQYYMFKYQFCGPFVVCTGLALLALAALESLWTAPSPTMVWRPAIALALTLLATVVVLQQFGRGFAFYAESATERAFGTPRFATFEALCDLDAARLAERIVARQHKKFGGFYSPRWAYTAFMNQQLRGSMLHWYPFFNDPDFVPGEGSLTQPGVCYFWDKPSSQFAAQGLPHAKKIRELEAMPQRACYRFDARTEPRGSEGILCSVCN